MPSVNYTPYGNLKDDIGSLGSALFPDPVKVLQARYLGTEARAKQVEILKGQQQLNEGPYIMGLTPHSGVAPATPTYYHPPGGNPDDPPILAPSAGITMAPGQTPSLGQTVTQPPAQAMPPPIPTQTLVDVATQGVHPIPAGVGTAGTPPPQASPAPGSGAPPAPTGTASDGSTPNNDPLSATMHPGTLWAPNNGGKKYAPPAQSDGSPAPLAFNPNLYMAHMLQAGYTAEQAKAGLASYVMQFQRDGAIDEHTATLAMAAAGNTAPLTAQTQITTTGMNNATTLAQQRMVTGETAREFNLGDVLTTDTPGGQPVHTARQDSFGKPAYDATYNTGFHREVLAQPTPGGPVQYGEAGTTAPGTPVYSPTHETERGKVVETTDASGKKILTRGTDLVSGTPGFTSRGEELGTTPVLVIDPANNNSLKTVSAADFAKGNYVRAPANIPPDQAGAAQDNLDQAMARRFPPPPVSVKDQAWLSPARANGADNARLVALQTQLYQTSPEGGVRGNWRGAADAAITQAQQEGWMPTEQEASENRAHFIGTGALSKDHTFQTQDPQGKTTNTFYLLPKKEPGSPASKQPLSSAIVGTGPGTGTRPAPAVTAPAPATSPPPTDSNPGFLSTLFTNPFNFKGVGSATAAPAPAPTPTPAPGGQLPPGAIGVAPSGVPDGSTATSSRGVRGTVRGGFIYPAETSSIQGR
jgi:hypothetical protein